MPTSLRALLLLSALALTLSACNDNEKSKNLGGRFTLRWTEGGYRLPDSQTTHALYYGKQKISWNIKENSLSPDPEIILYFKDEPEKDGIYVFNGHKNTDTRVRDVTMESYKLPSGQVWSSDAIAFPLFYEVHGSSDAAYVVLEDNNKRWKVIDIIRARVVPPGWMIATGGDTRFSAWESDRVFTAKDIYYADDLHQRVDHSRTTHVTVDPLEIRAEDGTINYPPRN